MQLPMLWESVAVLGRSIPLSGFKCEPLVRIWDERQRGNLIEADDTAYVLVRDIETIPDLKGFAAANGHDGKTDDEIRAELGERFRKHIYHSIVCIGALVAHSENEHWIVEALGAPHVGERSERDLIAAFVDKIAQLKPQLVTFNGSSFDLPVLRYRVMVHKVSAAALSARPYFYRIAFLGRSIPLRKRLN
jgi:predicted 3'-5' exonuclease similar to PolB exonuclease domain